MKLSLYNMVVFAAIALMIYSCSSKKLGELNQAKFEISPYSLSLKTEHFVYHTSNDSSEIHLKLPAKQLLSARKNGQSEFTGKLEVEVKISAINKPGESDTLVYQLLADIGNLNSDGTLYHKRKFYLLEGKDYKFEYRFTDKTRNTTFYSTSQVNKTKELDKENFLVINQKSIVPYFSSFLTGDSSVYLVSKRVDLSQLEYMRKAADLTLPPPPSSSSKNKLPELKEFTILELSAQLDTVLMENLKLGDLLIKNKLGNGLTYLIRPAGFPAPSSVYEMIQPLRYISSRKEFEKLEGSSNLKLALDKFWLSCGDSKERSKELIAIFYSRVEESNRFFTSYKSGWRTDRGLINIVFGAPNDLEISENFEIWTYGDKSDLGSVQFKFNKIENNISNNYYELERNPIYKSEWAKRVGAWRNGRIYN